MRSPTIRRLGLGTTLVLLLGFGIAPYALGAETGVTSTTATPGSTTTSVAEQQSESASTTTATHSEEEEPGHGGQPTKLACSDIDPGWAQLAVTGHPVSGHYTVSDAFRTVQVSVLDANTGGKVINWHSDGPIDAVILRSGQDAATYEYEPPALSDTGLLPPLKDREGRNLAAVLICYDPAGAVVGIDLSLGDSKDPVDVGDEFEYLLSATTTDPVSEALVTMILPPEVSLVAVGDCVSDGDTIACSPPLDAQASWHTTITVSAEKGGDAVARATLSGLAGSEPVEARAVEVTRIIGAGGHDGGCGDHGDDDECGGGAAALVAACSAAVPGADTVILSGPFANRRYLVEGPGDARIWVTVSEATGQQTLSWESSVPIDAVLSRTGNDIAEYAYSPLTFSGKDVTGPPGGKSAEPRPIADAAFCYLPRQTVDVGFADVSVPTMHVGAPATFTITLANNGYREASGVTLSIDGGEDTRFRSCGNDPTGDDRCMAGGLAPGATTVVEFDLVADSVGEHELSLEISSLNESEDATGDNVLTLSFAVEAAGSTQPGPGTTGPGTDSADVLPFTGIGPESLWLALLATLLLAIGLGTMLDEPGEGPDSRRRVGAHLRGD